MQGIRWNHLHQGHEKTGQSEDQSHHLILPPPNSPLINISPMCAITCCCLEVVQIARSMCLLKQPFRPRFQSLHHTKTKFFMPPHAELLPQLFLFGLHLEQQRQENHAKLLPLAAEVPRSLRTFYTTIHKSTMTDESATFHHITRATSRQRVSMAWQVGIWS